MKFADMLRSMGIKATELDFDSPITEYYTADITESMIWIVQFNRVSVSKNNFEPCMGYDVLLDTTYHQVHMRAVNSVKFWNFFDDEWIEIIPDENVALQEYRKKPTFHAMYHQQTGTIYVWEDFSEPALPTVISDVKNGVTK